MPYDCMIVEVDDEPAGLLAKAGDDYQFIASAPEAFALDRTVYPSISEAFQAVKRALSHARALEAV